MISSCIAYFTVLYYCGNKNCYNFKKLILIIIFYSYINKNLEGWDGEGGVREVQVAGDMGKLLADSC